MKKKRTRTKAHTHVHTAPSVTGHTLVRRRCGAPAPWPRSRGRAARRWVGAGRSRGRAASARRKKGEWPQQHRKGQLVAQPRLQGFSEYSRECAPLVQPLLFTRAAYAHHHQAALLRVRLCAGGARGGTATEALRTARRADLGVAGAGRG